ncbi:MAG: nucleotidyl transferase AbiEii/AbiGii toxin family protein [Verrucomicrobiota bacterium]
MNPDFLRVIAATPEDRRGLFLATANRLGTPLQNVEKDFWVSWVLDLLFNGRTSDEPRLLFKGGTSLSKAYGLISRFSEDIDITVFREDLGKGLNVGDLEGLSGKQQQKYLKAIKLACQDYLLKTLQPRLNQHIESVFQTAGLVLTEPPVVHDTDDADQQTLLVHYPSVSDGVDGYVKPAVKIEAGAKSALDPHRVVIIRPYVDTDISSANLMVSNVVTINAERTFWDKVMILHGLRGWHDKRGELRQQGHRVSRHYYDLYKLISSPVGSLATLDHALALDCARHALMFFNSPDLNLLQAKVGSFAIMPTGRMIDTLKRDYLAMSGMIFDEVPAFGEVIEAIQKLEQELNLPSR